MIAIIDYGVGNLFSLKCSFEAIGAEVVVTNDAETIKKADKLVLPGVGAFSDAAKKLKSSGLVDVLIEQKNCNKPILGICLGMQLLFEKSYEYGCHEGLGFIKGNVKSICDVIPNDFKVPHIGWNSLNIIKKDSKLFKYINDGDFVYFVHSFYGADCDDVSSVSNYGADLTATVEKDNVFGCQFHPEKSGEVGLNILRAFCE